MSSPLHPRNNNANTSHANLTPGQFAAGHGLSYIPSAFVPPVYMPDGSVKGGYIAARGYDPPTQTYGYSRTNGYFQAGSQDQPAQASQYSPPDGYVQAGGQDQPGQSYHDPSASSFDSQRLYSSSSNQSLAQEPALSYASYVHDDQETDDEDVPAPKRRKTVKPKPDQPQSKRAAKRAQIIEETGSVGANNKPKGQVREQDGGRLEWWDDDDKIWRLAAPHDDYRHAFIVEGNAKGTYDIAPEHGGDADDITTFASALDQQHWNIAVRDSWGNIVDTEGNKVLYLIEQPDRQQDPPEPGRCMTYDGLIMLDPDNHPVRDFPDVPRAFSSKIEGGRIEALRRIYGMTLLDCRARMPRNIKTASGWKPLFGLTTLNQRTSRFRDNNDSPAWRPNKLAKETKRRLRHEGLQNDENSTEGLTPLSKLEVEKRKLAGRGKHPERATGRAISQEERDGRDRKHAKEVRRLEEIERRKRDARAATEQYAQGQDAADYYPSPATTPGSKRKREYSATPDIDDGSSSPSQKQVRSQPPPAINPSLGSSPPLASSPPPAYSPGGYHNQQAAGALSPNVSFGQESKTEYKTLENDSGNAEMVDLRHLEPRSLAEQLSIRAALYYTRLHYRSLNDHEAPNTPLGDSYMSQYWQLQTYHQSNWSQYGEAPMLVGIGEWHGSFSVVQTPQLSDKLYSRLLQPSSNVHSPSLPGPISPAESNHSVDMPRYVRMSDVSPPDAQYTDFDKEDWIADLLKEEISNGTNDDKEERG